ncbi:putative lipid II flippase FtsW [Bacillus carboniphilus]|uniref:Probable peptidoglycan glycosyltransferase FtsW n=1 Tax=Bacillus carboniphilus TaxID=86663 RepID=A0ABY9JW96_9BACI|nr:putative lipid II flippase FtsW [Bacillus carboniphilus]WLR43660.1 putative lipid II flippase FtsW [Bacillus carboniphilus]
MKKIVKSYDFLLIVSVLALCGFGVVMIYSSSMVTAVTKYDLTPSFFFQRQIIFLLIGLFVFFVFALLPYRLWLSSKIQQLIFFGSIIMLIAVLAFGEAKNNAQSWIEIGNFQLQPSEFIKLGIIIYLAAVYEKKHSYINKVGKGLLPPIIFTCIICILIILQPDIGTASIIAFIAICIVFCSGMNGKSMFKLSVLALFTFMILSPVILWNHDDIFTDTRMARFTSFTDPFADEQGSGYQLVNSYIAINNGELTGLGLGEGMQKYGYLPEAHTDFIMAIVAEELGIIGIMIVIGLLGMIIFKGFNVAKRCKDPFGTLLAVGISSMLAIQASINLGGLTGLIPITGVTFPFISYGGSSLLTLLLSMGLLVNISMFVNYKEAFSHNSTKDAN